MPQKRNIESTLEFNYSTLSALELPRTSITKNQSKNEMFQVLFNSVNFTVYTFQFPDRWGVKNEKTNETFKLVFNSFIPLLVL